MVDYRMNEFWMFDAARWPAGDALWSCLLAVGWGLGSALLSPCHLGVIPIMGSHAAGVGPFETSGPRSLPVWQVAAFTFGYFATIPLLALVILFLGTSLEHVSHYWTIPVGLVLLWVGFDMIRSHACSTATHWLTALGGRLNLGPLPGAVVLGFCYGAISSGCTAGFLVPLLLAALPQGVAFGLGMGTLFGLGHSLPMFLVGCSAYFAARFYHSHPHEPGSGHHDSHYDPHRAERLFRRVMGGLIMLVGALFILHPFFESH